MTLTIFTQVKCTSTINYPILQKLLQVPTRLLNSTCCQLNTQQKYDSKAYIEIKAEIGKFRLIGKIWQVGGIGNFAK